MGGPSIDGGDEEPDDVLPLLWIEFEPPEGERSPGASTDSGDASGSLEVYREADDTILREAGVL